MLITQAATKALRSLFDLQARVSGLRQVGITDHIGRTIEKELKRYVSWAMRDAGLHTFAFMSNIRIKRFARRDMARAKFARRVERYFRDWAAEYRAYYAQRLPPTPPLAAPTATAATATAAAPRLLYGFVVVQHVVMLLTIDSARPAARTRCFANFNMSQDKQWMDSSLNVAISIHMARERLLKMRPSMPAADPSKDIEEDL